MFVLALSVSIAPSDTVTFANTLVTTPTVQDSRTWKDASGKFEVVATFVRVEGNKVVLKKADGTLLNVPLDKLSPIDQGYVEGRRSSSGGAENPFQEMSSDSGSPSTNSGSPPANSSSSASSGSGGMREFKVDFQAAPETVVAVGNWSPNLDSQPSSPIELKPIALKSKEGFWERFGKAAVNLTAKRAVISLHTKPPGKPGTTRMQLIDLESGRSLANASGEGIWSALAIHDDGERIVVQEQKDDQTQGQLSTVRLDRKNIIPIDSWRPYETMDQPAKEQAVRFVRFINNNRLLTLSQNGKVVIWDFETRQPVRRFSYHGACQPSLSNDRKYLAICGGDIFGIVNLEEPDETPSVKKAPQMNYWLSSSFSPSCKRFAAATMSKLMVWDVASGDVLFEGKIPGVPTNGSLYFPDEDFVMLNGDKLVEFSSGIKLWRYQGGAPIRAADQMLYVHIGDPSRMMPLEIPHAAAREMLAEAKSQSDLFILKKGAPVAIDLNDVPGQFRQDVEQKIKANIESKGFVYASSAPVSIKATITGPTTEAVSYHFAGSFVVRQFKSQLNIEYDGKSIWASSATNVPGAVSGRDQADIKQQLDKAGQSPNLNFFGAVQLPDFLQKPSGDGKNQDAQMLGVSTIGANGIE